MRILLHESAVLLYVLLDDSRIANARIRVSKTDKKSIGLFGFNATNPQEMLSHGFVLGYVIDVCYSVTIEIARRYLPGFQVECRSLLFPA